MQLTSAQAGAVIAAAETQASVIGVPVIVAVVDVGDTFEGVHANGWRGPGSIDIAMKKARTAVLFQANSEAVWEYCKPGAPAPALELTNGGLAPFGGGIPLRDADGELLGAVGVSGGAVAQDMEIAQVAAAALTIRSVEA